MVKRYSANDACDGAAEFAKGVRESRDARAMSTLIHSHTASAASEAATGTGGSVGSSGTNGDGAASTGSSQRPAERVDD